MTVRVLLYWIAEFFCCCLTPDVCVVWVNCLLIAQKNADNASCWVVSLVFLLRYPKGRCLAGESHCGLSSYMVCCQSHLLQGWVTSQFSSSVAGLTPLNSAVCAAKQHLVHPALHSLSPSLLETGEMSCNWLHDITSRLAQGWGKGFCQHLREKQSWDLEFSCAFFRTLWCLRKFLRDFFSLKVDFALKVLIFCAHWDVLLRWGENKQRGFCHLEKEAVKAFLINFVFHRF